MSLEQIQRDFIGWLRTAEEPLAERLGGGPGPQVYLNNHRAALMASLTAGYAQSRRWLGEAAFDAAAARHVEARAPTSWTLDAYADGFAETLAELYPDDLEVADVARLEHALETVFVAADAPALTVADIGQLDWDQARLRLTPTASILETASNADEILTALLEGAAPPAPELLAEPAQILVWRAGLVPRFRRLGPGEASLIARLQAGVAFADLCADLASEVGEEAGVAAAGAYLAQWTVEGLLARP